MQNQAYLQRTYQTAFHMNTSLTYTANQFFLYVNLVNILGSSKSTFFFFFFHLSQLACDQCFMGLGFSCPPGVLPENPNPNLRLKSCTDTNPAAPNLKEMDVRRR